MDQKFAKIKKENKKQPVYVISVVAEMLGVHPQTLRMYEREGFVTPKRMKRLRLYSEEDVERLNFVISLTRELGVNRAGVDIILRMRKRLESLQKEVEEIMGIMNEDMKDTFEKRIKKVLFEED